MASPTTLFIAEGEKRDVRFLRSLAARFMPGSRKVETLILPAARNIYMLYKELEKDGFEVDVVELLRESCSAVAEKLKDLRRSDIDEVYLFFDFDPQHFKRIGLPTALPQISEVLKTMLRVFDNETEFGKLYISYPMIEALYDYKRGGILCAAHSECYLPFECLADYKRLSGEDNPIANAHEPQWSELFNVFTLRARCLFGLSNLDFAEYRNCITPLSLYEVQEQLLEKSGMVFGLSALPEFLLDYFGEEFWITNVHVDKSALRECKHRARAINGSSG